jgi:drug/metabolite transporter (DMT)-like permease
MEPSEALSTAAQIAVALADFAGVVVVFRCESVHDWAPIDKFRLRVLLTSSIQPLALCVIGLLCWQSSRHPQEFGVGAAASWS